MGKLKKPGQAMDYQSQDRNFSVSWLLGLRPYPTRPSWAHLYETEERYFRVSRILGLIPSRRPRKSRRTRKIESALTKLNEKAKEEPDFGLRRLFSDGSEDDDFDESEGTDTDASNESDVEAPVLAEPAFLEFCKELEELLEDIE
jgi:hypothetical protein